MSWAWWRRWFYAALCGLWCGRWPLCGVGERLWSCVALVWPLCAVQGAMGADLGLDAGALVRALGVTKVLGGDFWIPSILLFMPLEYQWVTTQFLGLGLLL